MKKVSSCFKSQKTVLEFSGLVHALWCIQDIYKGKQCSWLLQVCCIFNVEWSKLIQKERGREAYIMAERNDFEYGESMQSVVEKQ